MKKLFLLFAVATMTVSLYSCRETTEENTEESIENAGEDLENAGEEVEQEIEDEANGNDDM